MKAVKFKHQKTMAYDLFDEKAEPCGAASSFAELFRFWDKRDIFRDLLPGAPRATRLREMDPRSTWLPSSRRSRSTAGLLGVVPPET